MLSERPTDPKVLARIENCLVDLRKLAVRRRKEKANGIEVGGITDNIAMLEDAVKYGANGGKVSCVSEPSLSVFKAHDLEIMIHSPFKSRHRGQISER